MKFTIVHAKTVDFTIYKSNFLYFPMFVAPPQVSTQELRQNYRTFLLFLSPFME